MAQALATSLTVVSASALPPSASWACAYAAERLPRALAVYGEDAFSAGETRAARKQLSLPDSILTRASVLAVARALGGTRVVMVNCREERDLTAIEAQAFEVDRPTAGEILKTARPRAEIAAAIDDLASRLAPTSHGGALAFRTPSPAALAKAGPGLLAGSASERARALVAALDTDPASIDLRLSAVEALIAARNFEAAIRLAAEPQAADTPGTLVRALRFQGGAAQLEAGRYAEASETFDALVRAQETAAALNNRGIARFRLRDPNASAVFERALTLADPRQSDISFNRCLALVFEGRALEALPRIEREIEGHLRDTQTHLLEVWALRLLDREAERGEAWDRLMAIAPSFSSLGNPDLARRLERIFFSERIAAP